mgnify:FL=1
MCLLVAITEIKIKLKHSCMIMRMYDYCRGEVFQEGQHVYKKLDVMVAYKKALSTWAAWVDRHVNPRNTTVFFRSYSPVHYT